MNPRLSFNWKVALCGRCRRSIASVHRGTSVSNFEEQSAEWQTRQDASPRPNTSDSWLIPALRVVAGEIGLPLMAAVALIPVGSLLGWNATPDVKLVSIGPGVQTLPFQLVVSSVENSVRSPSGDPPSQRLRGGGQAVAAIDLATDVACSSRPAGEITCRFDHRDQRLLRRRLGQRRLSFHLAD